jgi:hypothetical protein
MISSKAAFRPDFKSKVGEGQEEERLTQRHVGRAEVTKEV